MIFSLSSMEKLIRHLSACLRQKVTHQSFSFKNVTKNLSKKKVQLTGAEVAVEPPLVPEESKRSTVPIVPLRTPLTPSAQAGC